MNLGNLWVSPGESVTSSRRSADHIAAFFTPGRDSRLIAQSPVVKHHGTTVSFTEAFPRDSPQGVLRARVAGPPAGIRRKRFLWNGLTSGGLGRRDPGDSSRLFLSAPLECGRRQVPLRNREKTPLISSFRERRRSSSLCQRQWRQCVEAFLSYRKLWLNSGLMC